MADALQTLIEELEQDRSLQEPNRLRWRIEALDVLEAYLIQGQDCIDDAESVSSSHFRDRVAVMHAGLEALNCKQYQAIRREIQRGAGRNVLLEWVPEFARNPHIASALNGEGYDYLDALISGVLQFDEPGAQIAELAADMVFYQPTPARHIFDFFRRVALTERDVLVDLGSGLGHLPLLACICTCARSIGIELEAAYVDCARRSAQALNLQNVTFIQQDARAADLSRGTVFYLYTPFTGAILRTVLDALRQEANHRSIRICTLGPCTPVIAEERWLEPDGIPQRDRIVVFRSLPRPVE